MAPICSEQELDDLLSEPSDADRAAMRAIEGGLLILGAGGKMGPSLARRARRAAHQAGMPAGTSKRIVAGARFSDRGGGGRGEHREGLRGRARPRGAAGRKAMAGRPKPTPPAPFSFPLPGARFEK